MIYIIVLDINKNDIEIIENEPLVCGALNSYKIHLNFSDDWNGLQKTAFFMSGTDCEPCIIDSKDSTIIPWEILLNYDKKLYIEICGTRPDGTIVLPTIRKALGLIQKGTECVRPIHKPTPSVYDQILSSLSKKADRLFYNGKELLLMCGEEILSSIEVYDKDDDGTIDDIIIPTKLSEFINDLEFISKETDPTVPEWAKKENPPVYTANDVGADIKGTARTLVDSAVEVLDNKIDKKQDKLFGEIGQIVGFDENGNALPTNNTFTNISINIGSVSSGEVPSVSNSGTETDVVLDFSLVPGEKGDKGDSGIGIPEGGKTGQILAKSSYNNYDTEWIDLPSNIVTMEQVNKAIQDAINTVIQGEY